MAEDARKAISHLFPELMRRLKKARSLEEARRAAAAEIERLRDRIMERDPVSSNALEFHLELSCLDQLRMIFSRRGEKLSGFSSLGALWALARGEEGAEGQAADAFWQDLYHIMLGAAGRSPVYLKATVPEFFKMRGRAAAVERSKEMDKLAALVDERIASYPCGLSAEAVSRRLAGRRRAMRALGGSEGDWADYRWHVSRIIRDAATLSRIVELTAEEAAAISAAVERGLPFGITPYYASLMDRDASRLRDHAIRAQVIPPMSYVRGMVEVRKSPEALDFMGEADTSPVPLVTRRYPKIAIFKPFNTCPQICVYCQRNWEIKDAMEPSALASSEDMGRAFRWFSEHKGISEVLITGGDPMLLGDDMLDGILKRFERMRHIEFIRIGTRAPAALPMRITGGLCRILAARQRSNGKRLSVVTHFEHPYEVTPDSREAAARIRDAGINIYNQSVYTIENSRKFEMCALRFALKKIGVDPYYNFNAKGKAETIAYRVPLARILQERKEEARLTPGTIRTDEPMFNLPRLGKNYLRAGQDHHLVGFKPNGARVYEMLPWEKYLASTPTYIHEDVPIYDYLAELAGRGEDMSEYEAIWYYF